MLADVALTQAHPLRHRRCRRASHPRRAGRASGRGRQSLQAPPGGGRLRRPGDGRPRRRPTGHGLLPGLPCHGGGWPHPERAGGGRRLREEGQPLDRTASPAPQGIPAAQDRADAAQALHRARPRGKVQCRETEEGRSAARRSGRSERVALGRDPPLRGQEIRGRVRGHGLRSEREPHAARGREEPAALEGPFPQGGARLRRDPDEGPLRVRPEGLGRWEGRGLRARAGHDAHLRRAGGGEPPGGFLGPRSRSIRSAAPCRASASRSSSRPCRRRRPRKGRWTSLRACRCRERP